jgi:hypothetical protein
MTFETVETNCRAESRSEFSTQILPLEIRLIVQARNPTHILGQIAQTPLHCCNTPSAIEDESLGTCADRLYFVIGQIKIVAQEGSGKQPAEAGAQWTS